jgi:putative transposase
MPRGQKFKAEEIIAKLREAEVELARGKKIPEVCKQIGVTEQTYYRWKKEYGGLRVDQAKRLKDLEKENARLKRLLADAELDKAILKEAASGNSLSCQFALTTLIQSKLTMAAIGHVSTFNVYRMAGRCREAAKTNRGHRFRYFVIGKTA